MSNPYRGINDYCFWSRGITNIHHSEIDPCVEDFPIKATERISTMGSCFAQHLSRFIVHSGANYFIAEVAPKAMSAAEAERHNFGVFSARYGNVYTVTQAIQLFDRAYGAFAPIEDVWRHGDRYVDAFRPQVNPDRYESDAAVRVSRDAHFEAVRAVFEQSDWLVFTLGLTEAWRSRDDGAVFPIAPGVAGGVFDPHHHEFVNFSAQQVTEQLSMFIARLRSVNKNIKILLTVSPVPLIATYENRHVLVSTTYSKSALRVAAEEAAIIDSGTIYFPSYELITNPATCGYYYSEDLRQVTDIGVQHVMRVFKRHFLAPDSVGGARAEQTSELKVLNDSSVICDEQLIEDALRRFERRP